MKPVLYESTETSFTSNGLGRLSDAMSCNVVEERNGAYELTMQYPVTGIHFSDITHSRIICAVPADGKGVQPFRIYYISKPLNETVEVKAEHISYQLSHIPVNPFTAGNCSEAMARLKTYSAETNPFTFWTDKTTVASFNVKTPSSIRSLLGGTKGSILDSFGGGEFEFDKYTVKLHNSRGIDNNVKLQYGKNIMDIKQEENIGSTYTGVYPYWLGTVDNAETLITLPEKVLHSANAQNFPYQRTVPLDLSSEFEAPPTEAELRTRAQAYMAANNIGVPDVNIEVNFIALWQTEEYKQFANLERVNLCDLVTVEFPLLGISAKAKVVKTDYDVLKEKYNKIEVGDVRTSLATQITQSTTEAVNALAQQVPTKTFLQQAIDHATQLISGGLGGHVVFNLNADGEPQEILIMDTDNIQTAVKVIRINQNGIGFSTNGYAGPFTTAWTIDGRFNADFITAGAIDAALITAGFLSADRIQGGTLTMGGANNGNGQVIVKDANGNTIGTIDNTGANIRGNIILTTGEINARIGKVFEMEFVIYSTLSAHAFWDSHGGLRMQSVATDRWHSLKNSINIDEQKVTQVIDGDFETTVHPELPNLDPETRVGDPNFTHFFAYYISGSQITQHAKRYGSGLFQFIVQKYNITSGSIDPTSETSQTVPVTNAGARGIAIGYNGIAFGSRATTSQSDTGDYTIAGEPFDVRDQRVAFILNRNVFFLVSDGKTLLLDSNGFQVNGQPVSLSSNSSKRYKQRIEVLHDDRLDPHRLLELKPKQFQYKDDTKLQYVDMEGETLPGFIAEEVEEIYPSAVIHNKDGSVESWDERRIIPGMLSLIQEQQEAIESLTKRVEALEAQLYGGEPWNK